MKQGSVFNKGFKTRASRFIEACSIRCLVNFAFHRDGLSSDPSWWSARSSWRRSLCDIPARRCGASCTHRAIWRAASCCLRRRVWWPRSRASWESRRTWSQLNCYQKPFTSVVTHDKGVRANLRQFQTRLEFKYNANVHKSACVHSSESWKLCAAQRWVNKWTSR